MFFPKPIPIPADATCQEASPLSRETYIPCGATATAIVYHEKDHRGYYMCDPCADHNLRHRGGKLVALSPISVLDEKSYR
jgi:hypothetical protein